MGNQRRQDVDHQRVDAQADRLAKTNDDKDQRSIRGFKSSDGSKGFRAKTRRASFRCALRQSELVLEDVRVPREALLPKSGGLKSPLMCLTQARYGISWGALGAAMACFEEASSYAKTRIMFDRPIGGFQLQQLRLAEMLSEIVKAQLLCVHLGRLKDRGEFTPQQVSLAKRNNVHIATDIAREARVPRANVFSPITPPCGTWRTRERLHVRGNDDGIRWCSPGGPGSTRSERNVKIASASSGADMESRFRISPDGKTVDETGLKFDMSDFDGYAVEVALRSPRTRSGESWSSRSPGRGAGGAAQALSMERRAPSISSPTASPAGSPSPRARGQSFSRGATTSSCLGSTPWIP